MAKLIAKPALEADLPIIAGGVALSMPDVGTITALAPYDDAALGKALKAAHGMTFPKPGRVSAGKGGARCVWSGRGQAFLIGPAPDATLAAHAALSAQSDGWVTFRLEGPGAADVLARLCPLDLRGFGKGRAARSELAHMMALITGDAAGFDIMVFRSMAQTALHDLTRAMKSVAAQGDR